MPAITRPLFEQIDTWLAEISETTKSASANKTNKTIKKKAGPSGMGESSHPSDNVDNNTQQADMGSRYSENSEDIKSYIPGQSVDEASADDVGSQDDKQYNIGTNQSSTGEDPSVEDDYKGNKEDPGTSHPANADDTGEKYSSMNLKALLKLAEAKANSLLADITNDLNNSSSKSAYQTNQVQRSQVPMATLPQPTYEPELEKLATEIVAQAIKDADLDADLVGSYLHSYYNTLVKTAAGEEEESSKSEEEEDPPVDAGGGDVPPEMLEGVGDVGKGGNDDAALLAALGSGRSDGDMGGVQSEGNYLDGLGGEMGGDMPPDAADGMSQEDALQELVMALQELGISPEMLAQMAQGQGAKLASAAKAYQRSGRFRVEPAKTAAQREVRNQIKEYIREIAGLVR